jgi:tetratricopeptide (TPR) repeat protein
MIVLKSRSKKQKRSKWRLPLIALVLAGAGFGAFAAYQSLKPAYRRWKANRSVAQARAFFQAHNIADADVALRVAFEAGGSVEAYVLLADMLEAGNSSEAVEVRREATKVSPNDVKLRLALAETAMKFNDDGAAEEALAAVGERDRSTQPYRRVAAGWALHTGDWAGAEKILGELEKDPKGGGAVRVLRDAILIHNKRPEKADAARADLHRMTGDPATRLAALRVLVRDASDRRDVFAAMDVGDEMAKAPDASFDDLLGAASAQNFARPGTGASPALLERLRTQAEKDLPAAAQYVRWLILHQHTDEAWNWLGQLPDPLAKSPQIDSLKSEILVVKGDWGALRSHLAEQDWGSLSDSSIEFAYVAHLARDEGNADLATQSWGRAIEEAHGSEPALLGLARLATAWKWAGGVKDALMAAVRQFPKDARIYIRLVGVLRAQRDTRALYALTTQWLAAFPSDRLQCDAAMLSLLLDPPTAPNPATAALEQLHSKDLQNPYYTTDYAYSLLRLGQVRSACAQVDGLQAEERKIPARVPYIASIYAAAGRLEDARAVLAAAPPVQTLLPEEEALLSEARLAAAGR